MNNLNKENPEAIKEEINNYSTNQPFSRKYIPHNTIIIVLFILSIMLILFKSKINNMKHAFFILLLAIISNSILLIRTLQSSAQYIDYNSLSGEPIITIISMLTAIINLTSFVIIILTK